MLDADTCEFINRRADAVMASANADGRPTVCWGAGCRVDAQGRVLTIWFAPKQAVDFLADLQATGLIAATFTEPQSNRTLQFKGTDARVRPARAADALILREHLHHLADQLTPFGFALPLLACVFEHPIDELMAVEFTPSEAFTQTPGPRAGEAMKVGP